MKFRPLAEKYALFDNLPISLIYWKHRSLYSESAWGAQAENVSKGLAARSGRDREANA